MEIVDSTLVLHRKQGKKGNSSIIWPLNTIRRYGYEDDTFCFETGHSSPSGEGIYGFKCKYAKHIFDALQETLKVPIMFFQHLCIFYNIFRRKTEIIVVGRYLNQTRV